MSSVLVPAISSDLYAPFAKLPTPHVWLRALIWGIRGEVKRIISTSVVPAMRRLRDFFKDEYIRHLRKEPDIHLYGEKLRFQTGIRSAANDNCHNMSRAFKSSFAA